LPRLLTAEALELDHLGAEVGEQHPAARSGLESRQLQDADAVEGAAAAVPRGAHFDARTSTPARSSCKSHGAVKSRSPQPLAIAAMIVCSAIAAISIGTWYSRASAVASPRSLRRCRSAKRTVSKSPLKTMFGSTCVSVSP